MHTKTAIQIKEKAPVLLQEIKKAKSVLLHCHPSPDPDSVGSALAMKFVLEQIGIKATVIKGDSDIPEAFEHFPGCKEIVKKDYFEVDLSEYDLFIVLDSASKGMISKKGEVVFPPNLKTIVIDHHRSNEGYGDSNLIEYNYPATAQVLADLFLEWGIKFDQNISSNLFVGLYSDSLFKYPGVSSHTFEVATILSENITNIWDLIEPMETSFSPHLITFKKIALNNTKTYLSNHFAVSCISFEELKKEEVDIEEIRSSFISTELRSVKGWFMSACLIETEENYVKVSLRSQNGDKYDVSRLAVALGGGGHKAAAGVELKMSIREAEEQLIKKAEELYNL